MGKHESLARRIRELRQELGWTQQGLSTESGLSRSYISRLEMGDIALPSNERLKALSSALHTNTDDLLQAAGFLDSTDADHDLPEIKSYLRQRYGISEPHLLHAVEILVRELQIKERQEA
jgi:transcriptional regulator with XRE-family HTH domain